MVTTPSQEILGLNISVGAANKAANRKKSGYPKIREFGTETHRGFWSTTCS